MHVTVSLTIELDASASLTDSERQIQAAGREAMKEALKQAMRQGSTTRQPARRVEANGCTPKEQSAESC